MCIISLPPAEASSNLARYDGVGFGYRASGKDIVDMYIKSRSTGFGEEVKRRIMIGNYVLSAGYYDAYYLTALKVRTLLKRELKKLLSGVNYSSHLLHQELLSNLVLFRIRWRCIWKISVRSRLI